MLSISNVLPESKFKFQTNFTKSGSLQLWSNTSYPIIPFCDIAIITENFERRRVLPAVTSNPNLTVPIFTMIPHIEPDFVNAHDIWGLQILVAKAENTLS
jgi:hypothetical protein